ncbi:amino acid permease, partial [bacterium]|nr:amino acid permease [bacterium]
YIGFDAVSTAAQECRNPQRDLPIGILGSLGFATILYVLVAVVLTGSVHYSQLNVPDPIAIAVDAFGPQMGWLKVGIKCGALAGLSSVILVMLMGQTRVFYAMAHDGFLPAWFKSIHPRFHSPSTATLVTTLVGMGIAGFFPIQLLSEMVSIGTLLAFGIVCVGIVVLRRQRPDLPRPFKTPWVPLVPLLGAFAAFAQMLALHPDTWLRLVAWLAMGGVVYWFYGRRVTITQEMIVNHDPDTRTT